MIAAALALLLAQEPAAAPPDVVVVAQRLRRFKARTRTDRRTGLVRCDIRRSSGDPLMDAAVCDAVLACAAPAAKMPAVQACMQGRMPAIMARFAPANPPDGWSLKR